MDSLDTLYYLTSAAIEKRVCGEKTVSVDLLKSITAYRNCSEDHEAIRRFWRVFESLSQEERQMYLSFVWGRSRLPIDL